MLEGLPILVVEHGEIIRENLRRERMTEDEVAEEMRQQQIASLDDVDRAIIETNGTISFIQR